MRTAILILFLFAAGAQAENLIHNSSFECGADGWFTFGNPGGNVPQGNAAPVIDHIVGTNNCAVHGAKAIYFWSELWSRPIWLTNGTYTLSFYAYSQSTPTLNVGVMKSYQLNQDHVASLLPTNSVSVGTTKTRFAITIGVPTNGFHVVELWSASATVFPTLIDAVQLEPGGSVTPYAPQTLEFGIRSADSYNNLFLADTKRAVFDIWNDGPATNITIVYKDVHGIWNSNIQSGTIETNALRANTNTSINLDLPTLWGPHRLFGYITNVNMSWAEAGISLLPFAPQSGRDTNGVLGIHVAYEGSMQGQMRRIGFTWARYFSPAFWSRWEFQFPTLATTNMNPPGTWYSDYMFQSAATNDLVPFVELSPVDEHWYPETNASLAVMIGDYTNYVGRMVTRYKDAPYNIKHWEVFNEPQQTRPTVQTSDTNIYANIYTNAARLIKTIDPTATVIAFGGYSDATMAGNAWQQITPQGKTDADFLSFHIYPVSSGNDDPNLPDDYSVVDTGNFDQIRARFPTNNNLLNSETATRDVGGYHTINQAFYYPYYFAEDTTHGDGAPWVNEAEANEMEVRQVPSVDRCMYNFLRTVGFGYKQYNIQYGRAPDFTMFQVNTPSIYEWNGALKPWAAALVIGNNFVRGPGLGHIVSASGNGLEGYMFSNSVYGCVAPVWCNTRGTYTLTLSNSSFGVFDTVGNLERTNSGTAVITRTPRYFVSTTLSATQLWATIQYAAMATNQDTLAPALTIDMQPIGNVQVWGITNIFKATAIDERVMAFSSQSTTAAATNVMYRWTLNDGATFSPWGQTNHFYYSYPAPGAYRVGWQAKDVANNMSEVTYGAYFGALAVGVTNTLNASASANIGTIIVP